MGQIQSRRYASVTADTTNFTVLLTSAATAGNTLILALSSTAVINTPSGWEKIGESLNYLDVGMFRKTAVGGETSIAVTTTSPGQLAGHVYEYNDMGATGAVTANIVSASVDDVQLEALSPAAASYCVAFISTTEETANGTAWWAPLVVSAAPSQTYGAGGNMRFSSAAGVVAGGASVTPAITPGDSSGLYNHQGVAVLIAQGVTAPAALSISVGADQTIRSDQSATLTATASGGSGAKTYAWTKTSGRVGTFFSATSTTTAFTPSGGAGEYVLRCTVTDVSGSAFDEVTLTVTEVSTQSPQAYAHNGTEYVQAIPYWHDGIGWVEITIA